MFNYLTKFRRDEDGAVTVDWVVLTAAIVGLAIAIIAAIASGALDQSTSVGSVIDTMSIGTF
jgi:Flp pilus assembly pilin Flp